ncbi:MAG: ABC transporter substrate-binding protein [Phreatobacter sp.]|nr:ABC transporter substrate-binding protein [Bradyrhizobium sp.]
MRTLPGLAVFSFVIMAPLAARAADPYVIGVSAAMSGPAAGTYAGQAEGMKLYIDRLNTNGGIKGRQVRLVILDDQGQPSRAASNMRRLLNQDNALLVVSTSVSSTFAPIIADATRAGVPLLFAGSVCPQETMPPAAPLLFCSTAFSSVHDSVAMMDFVRKHYGTKIKIGFAAMGIPISRAGVEEASRIAAGFGMTVVGTEVAPPGTVDYTAYATKFHQAGADVVLSWAPWSVEVGVYNALRKIGWNGHYVTAQLAETEQELASLKDPKLIAIGTNSMLFEGLPAGDEIIKALKSSGLAVAPERIVEGWVGGIVIETALSKLDGDATPAALQAALAGIKIDMKGLRGGPLSWTKDNHFRAVTYYKVFRWNDQAKAMEVAAPWAEYAVK